MQHYTLVLTVIAVLLAATALCAAPGKGSDQPQAGEVVKGFLMKSVEVDGKPTGYVVYVPPEYDPAKPMPTIIHLNGHGECGTDGLRQVFHFGCAVILNVEKWPFIIVFPQKQSPDTAWQDEEAMAMAALDKTRREYNVDQSRIYLTGLSQGGHGTWAIAANHPDLFAAIAPICGSGEKSMAEKLVNMPIWIFHGEDDPVVNVESARQMAEYLKAAGGSCKLTIYPGVGHNSWDKAYREEELGEWFLQHRKPAPE